MSSEIRIVDHRTSHLDDEIPEKREEDKKAISDSEKPEQKHFSNEFAGASEPVSESFAPEMNEEISGPGGPLSLLSLSMPETVNFFMGILIQRAWINLGLIADPETGQLKKNFEDAGLCIELIVSMTEPMKGHWGIPELEQEIQTQLTNLRLNFAKLSLPKE